MQALWRVLALILCRRVKGRTSRTHGSISFAKPSMKDRERCAKYERAARYLEGWTTLERAAGRRQNTVEEGR
jgi:hypothetical protein